MEQAESEHAPARRSTKRLGKHPGRQELPANLPRVERILPVVESCRRLQVPVRDYLFPLLSPGLPISRSGAFQTLLPLGWGARHS
jgi:hypothetical protein